VRQDWKSGTPQEFRTVVRYIDYVLKRVRGLPTTLPRGDLTAPPPPLPSALRCRSVDDRFKSNNTHLGQTLTVVRAKNNGTRSTVVTVKTRLGYKRLYYEYLINDVHFYNKILWNYGVQLLSREKNRYMRVQIKQKPIER